MAGAAGVRDALGERLHLARAGNHENQKECASTLKSLGAPRASQAAVSEWERGETLPSDAATIQAIRTYVEQYFTAAISMSATGLAEGEQSGSFSDISRALSGEPLLTPRQGALMDAFMARLSLGPPLSEADLRAFKTTARFLGMHEIGD